MTVSKSCYLAGPISGLSYNDATDWREEVIDALRRSSIKGLSPLRAKVYLRETGNISDEYTDADVDTNAFVNMSTSRGIMTRDFFDCTQCDVVLVNLLETERVSIGTVMEIAWAYSNRIPVIAVMEKTDNLHDHAMIREAIGYRVETLKDAVEIIKAFLGDY